MDFGDGAFGGKMDESFLCAFRAHVKWGQRLESEDAPFYSILCPLFF